MTDHFNPLATEPTDEDRQRLAAVRHKMAMEAMAETQRLREEAEKNRQFWLQHERETNAAIAAQEAQQARVKAMLGTKNRDAVIYAHPHHRRTSRLCHSVGNGQTQSRRSTEGSAVVNKFGVPAPWVFTTKCKTCGRQMKPRRTEIDECCLSARYRCPKCNTNTRQLWPCKQCMKSYHAILRPKIRRMVGEYIGWEWHPFGFLGKRKRHLPAWLASISK
jgi:hypothetical protein